MSAIKKATLRFQETTKSYSKLRLLVLAVTLSFYLLIGALIFHHLESPNQRQDFDFVVKQLTSFYNKYQDCGVEPSDIRKIVEAVLLACRDGFHYLDNSTNILTDNITDRWDLPSSFFFSATVVTTIGYGRLAPQTREGRNVCILYALLGIPLTALLLQEVGHIFKDKGILLMTKINDSVKKLNKSKTFIKISTWLIACLVLYVVLICLPAVVFSQTEGWSYQDAHYFCFISLTTIGFGDHVVGDSENRNVYRTQWTKWVFKILTTFYLLCGLSIIAIVFNMISSGSQNKVKEFYNKRRPSPGNKEMQNDLAKSRKEETDRGIETNIDRGIETNIDISNVEIHH